jgi:hypothetical protein
MAAANTDKFIKGARRWSGQIGASGVADGSVTTIPLVSTTNLPTDTAVEITIDRVDANGNTTPTKEEVVRGVVSGLNIINAVRGVEGTAQAHSAGAVVEVRLTADQWNRQIDALTSEHDQSGIHKIGAPRGFLINGKIVPSVASNNLTVAIKTLAGSDPSATDPVYCRIGDTVRSITAALSVTKNAGTNWCNAGSSELATKEIDYFVYLGYNATDGVVIGFSRIPFATEYDDFSATTTNEKYCAISTITNAAAGDDYEVIGRFAATLSAGAGYTWTVPTFTNKNLIQRPIYETRWLSAINSPTGFSSITVQSTSYKLIGRAFFAWMYAGGTSNAVTFTVKSVFNAAQNMYYSFRATDNGSISANPGLFQLLTGSATVDLYKDFAGTTWTNSGNKEMNRMHIFYEI